MKAIFEIIKFHVNDVITTSFTEGNTDNGKGDADGGVIITSVDING